MSFEASEAFWSSAPRVQVPGLGLGRCRHLHVFYSIIGIDSVSWDIPGPRTRNRRTQLFMSRSVFACSAYPLLDPTLTWSTHKRRQTPLQSPSTQATRHSASAGTNAARPCTLVALELESSPTKTETLQNWIFDTEQAAPTPIRAQNSLETCPSHAATLLREPLKHPRSLAPSWTACPTADGFSAWCPDGACHGTRPSPQFGWRLPYRLQHSACMCI